MTAVTNGIVEDAQNIEDQIQLSIQTALQDDPQPWTDEEVDDELVAPEVRQEILAAPEPQPEPLTPTEPDPEGAATAEVSIGAEVCDAVEEAPSSVEEAAPVETVVDEVAPDVKSFSETTEVDSALESVVTVRADAVVEVATAVPTEASPEVTILTDETFESESADAQIVEEEAAAEVLVTPAEVDACVEVPNDSAATVTASAAPHESSDQGGAAVPALSEGAAPDEAVLQKEASTAAETPASQTTESGIDAEMATATIQEFPQSSPVTVEAHTEPLLAVEETTVPPTVLDDPAQPAETPCPTEPTPAPATEAEPTAGELLQEENSPESTPGVSEISSEVIPEATAETMASESTADSAAPADISVVESMSADTRTLDICRYGTLTLLFNSLSSVVSTI